MNTETSKIALVKMILNIENDTFIQRIAKFINKEKADFWNELTSKEQKEILLGLEQLNKGKRILFEDVLKKIS